MSMQPLLIIPSAIQAPPRLLLIFPTSRVLISSSDLQNEVRGVGNRTVLENGVIEGKFFSAYLDASNSSDDGDEDENELEPAANGGKRGRL